MNIGIGAYLLTSRSLLPSHPCELRAKMNARAQSKRRAFADVKELTPEFYSQPEFLRNSNDFNLGMRQVWLDHRGLHGWAGWRAFLRPELVQGQAGRHASVCQNLRQSRLLCMHS